MSFHFFSKKVSDLLKQRKRNDSMMYFIFTKHSVSVLVCHNYQLGEFVLQLPILVDDNSGYWDWKQDQVKQLIVSSLLTDHQNNDNFTQEIRNSITVSDCGQWKMCNGVAEKWKNQLSNIILAGDSAHVFPPAGGYGLNTGIQDAHCLAHKLKNIVNQKKQFSSEGLKVMGGQYERQRKQISKQISKFAAINYKKSKDIANSFGLDVNQAKRIADMVTKYMPTFMQPFLIQTGLSVGRYLILSDQKNIQNGKQYLQDVKNTIPLIFPNQDTGYKYCEQGLDQLLIQNFDQVDKQVIRVQKGCLLPHIWMKVYLDNRSRGSKVKVQSLRQFHSQNYLSSKGKEKQLVLKIKDCDKGQMRIQQASVTLEAKNIEYFLKLFKGLKQITVRSDGHIKQCVFKDEIY